MPNTDQVPQREKIESDMKDSFKKKYKEEQLFASARIVAEASLKGTELNPRNTKAEDAASSMVAPQCEQECGKPQTMGLQEGGGGQQVVIS